MADHISDCFVVTGSALSKLANRVNLLRQVLKIRITLLREIWRSVLLVSSTCSLYGVTDEVSVVSRTGSPSGPNRAGSASKLVPPVL